MELVSRMMDGSIEYPGSVAPPEPVPGPPIGQSDKVTHLERVEIFRGLTARELEAIARITEVLDALPGHVLTRMGEPGEQFFLLVDGFAMVEVSAEHRVRLGPGACFGEMSLLDGGPRSATIAADTPIRVLVIGRQGFWQLLRQVPALAERLLITLSQRVRQAEKSIIA